MFGDIGEVAVKFAAIESVADNEMVGNGEQRKVCLEIDKTSGRLIEKGDDLKRQGLAGKQKVVNVL